VTAAPDAVALLAAPAILTRDQIRATTGTILAVQRPDGAIPWYAGEHLDPWDHVEAAMALDAAGEPKAAARAYDWLAATQHADGSWYAGYRDDPNGIHEPCDTDLDANFTGYVAVGAWHHWRATGDIAFARRVWPVVDAALGFVLDLRRPDGTVAWHRDARGAVSGLALLAGNCSLHHALRCGLALADALRERRPHWARAAGRLRHAIGAHPDWFANKDRYAMDWYYPVLGTALRGRAARDRLAAGWSAFVVPDLGVRCVSDRPWVIGDHARAAALLRDVQRLRSADGDYWTGYVYADDTVWPRERTTWTSGSVLLALAMLAGDPATVAVFGGTELPDVAAPACDADGCQRDAAA
jgi:GH15 family glucan-1,4-alpha-glucosidase